MTALLDPPSPPPESTSTSTPSAGSGAGDPTSAAPPAAPSPSSALSSSPPPPVPLAIFTPRRIAAVAVAWVLVTLVGVGCVIYGIGPMLETRDQGDLLSDFRTDLRQKAAEAEGLPGIEEVTDAPAAGDPVAIVEIASIELRQVVVEGVGSQQTRRAPGHVPGTAALGQPSNAVVVGRHAGFGGPFSQLGDLSRGDEIGVVTLQGESLYRVQEVGSQSLSGRHDEIYGPSDDDRLTLVTSASIWPLSTGRATVVVAELVEARPFERTRQNGFISSQDGRRGDGAALPVVVLAVLGYACAAAGAVLLYRRTRPRSAYLMSAPLLVVAVVLVAEASARLLPAWF